MVSCPKGCLRHVSRPRTGTVAFYGLNAVGELDALAATRVSMRAAMAAEYEDMVSRTRLGRPPPTLEFYDDLHGVGGLFIGDQWAILIGERDMERIARNVIRQWPQHVARLYMNGNGGQRGTPQAVLAFAVTAATRRCIAHELGHALIYRGGANPYHPDAEAGADYYAGRLDAARGRHRLLGEMFFYSIGCIGDSCTHPSPPNRAAAYGAGYQQQLAA